MLSLLRAMSISHVRAQRLESVQVVVSIVIAFFGLAASMVAEWATPVTVMGAMWAIAYSSGLASWAGTELRRAAILQEMFDVRLFRLSWNSVAAGNPIPAQEVNRLSRRYRKEDEGLRDYYEIFPLPRPYDVLACQLMNLGWGGRIRRRYAATAAGAVGLWTAVGLLVGAAAELTVGQLILRWYIPSLGALMLGMDIYRNNWEMAAERDHVFIQVRDRILRYTTRPATAEEHRDLLVLARQVQDTILASRRRHIRVPNWFFAPFRRDDRADFQAVTVELRKLLDLRSPPR